MSTWIEVRVAANEKRCELILSGPPVSKRIEEDGIDSTLFKISHLNFLEISKTCLTNLPVDIGQLANLTRLILCNNELKSLPSTLGSLKKLKFLNVSSNNMEAIPAEIGNLTELQSLNLSYNKVTSLPVLTKLVNLVSVNISHNEFTELPVDVFDQNLVHFTELVASNNKIAMVPSSINTLSALKLLDLGDNSISKVPGELGDCTKLKELNLKGNKLQDKRLLKLVDQCHVKQVMEYIRSHCPKSSSGGAEEGKQGKSKKKAKQNKKAVENDEVDKLLDQIEVLHVKDDTVKVISTPNVQDIRPYIVCCVIHNISLEKDNKFKKFITLQTKLHETVCEKRNAATIATHDLSKITGDVVYDAKPPGEIKITPLGRKKEVSAADLYTQLNEEADALRKEKKKNTYSGIHKYLYLLKDKSLYPCLLDSTGQVLSFPPITNCDGTKISESTKSVLVEVSGNALSVCKKVMDTLLQESLKLGIGEHVNSVNGEDLQAPQNYLNVEQVKVVDEEGHLKVVYPSRTDIQIDGVNVVRV